MIALAAAAAIAIAWSLREPTTVTGDADLYIVPPVTVDHADAETAWVRLGVMDYIATRLREDGHLSVLPSARVVALLDPSRTHPLSSNPELIALTGASHLIEASASRRPGGWHLAIDSTAHGKRRTHVGDGATLLAAADRAIASMLAETGGRIANTSGSAANPLDESTQRIDAALLEGNLAGARSVLASLSPAAREAPQIRVREGQILFRGGRIDEADGAFSALEARLVDWPIDVQAQALMGLGAVAVRRHDFAAAEKRYAEALAVLGEQGSQELVGNGYNGRGVARAANAQFDLALADFSRARIALGRAGDTPGVASIDTNLGLLEARRGQWAQALQAFDRAIEVFTRFRISDNLAAALLGKGHTELALLEPTDARYTAERADELAANLENPVLGHEIMLLHATILLRLGELSAASNLLGRIGAESSAEAAELAIELALARHDGADALDRARTLAGHAADARHADLLVRAALAADVKPQQVASEIQAAIGAAEASANDGGARLTLALARARWLAWHDDGAAATEAFEAALAAMDRTTEPDLRIGVLCAYVDFLVLTRRLDRATELSGQIESYADRDYRAARSMAGLYRTLGDRALLAPALERVRALSGERPAEPAADAAADPPQVIESEPL
jgi:tetratricopeptide (TPR) repeat protein